MERVKFGGFAGLRVFAITMVIAGHVGALSASAGGIGNKIFFCLSGFLAYFSLKNIEGLKSVARFYWKKIVRIIPSYYILLLFAAVAFPTSIFLMSLSSDGSLLLNMLFIRNFGHLWFLQQIMLMYLVSPVFIMIVKLVERRIADVRIAKLVSALVLIVLAVIEKRFLTSDVFRLSGAGSHAQFAVWMFLAGFSTALVYEATTEGKAECKMNNTFVAIIGIYEVLFFLILFLMVCPSLREQMPEVAHFFDDGVLRTVMSCLAIFGLAITPAHKAKEFLDNSLFTIVSDCSFEIYIIHFFLIERFGEIGVKRRFLVVCFVSFCIALTVHTFVEKAMVYRKKSLVANNSL